MEKFEERLLNVVEAKKLEREMKFILEELKLLNTLIHSHNYVWDEIEEARIEDFLAFFSNKELIAIGGLEGLQVVRGYHLSHVQDLIRDWLKGQSRVKKGADKNV